MRFSNGFTNNPFMMGYDNCIFEENEDLGFVLPRNRIVTSSGFVTINNYLEGLESIDTKVVLNLGDSSTSGWNSNRVYKGCKDPDAPFFTYKTYSQLLEEQSDSAVINAGVPGYSSLQGSKYLSRLLKKLSTHHIPVDYVTVYFGNNDSTYNKHEDKVRLDRKRRSKPRSCFRVSTEDYRRNLRDMVETARDYGAKPILIMPVVNYAWEPGIRSVISRDEFQLALEELDNPIIRCDLEGAVSAYKNRDFETALELDKVLPRIKERYRKILVEVADEMDVSLIDVQDNISSGGLLYGECFVDYCHALEPINQMIVDRFFEIVGVEKMESGLQRGDYTVPLRYKLLRGLAKVLNILGGGSRETREPPSDIYTLH